MADKKPQKSTSNNLAKGPSGKQQSTATTTTSKTNTTTGKTKASANTTTTANNTTLASSSNPTQSKTKANAQVTRQPIELLLGDFVVNASGDKVSPTRFVVEGGIIGLYFAGKWCPPCRQLFPSLMQLYEKVRKADEVFFEMVFVSFDNTEDSFKEYLNQMPWWAVDFQDDERREAIASQFEIRVIPVLVLLDASTLEPITNQGIAYVKTDPCGADFPWRDLPKPAPSPPVTAAVAEALQILSSVLVADLLMADQSMAETQQEAETSAESSDTQ